MKNDDQEGPPKLTLVAVDGSRVEGGAARHASPVAPGPSESGDPVFTEGYFAEGGETFLRGEKRTVRIASFVPRPLREIVGVRDLDSDAEDGERRVVIEYAVPSGGKYFREVTLSGNRGAALVNAAPNERARLSATSAKHVALAAGAFTAEDYTETLEYWQTGWLPDGGFALPGNSDVKLEHLELAGVKLLQLPGAADSVSVADAASTLLSIVSSAPVGVTAPLLATIVAGPIFRRSEHLGTRGFITLLAGTSMAGKTTLARHLYGLVGRFHEQPSCIATWSSTPLSLEIALHALRDLPVFIDNLRATDSAGTENFRRVATACGDGAFRGRSYGGTSARARRCNALVLATGEHTVDDDAGVAGRVIEIAAQGIEVQQLLDIPQAHLECMPHLFSAYLAFVGGRDAAYWATRRSEMRVLGKKLRGTDGTRASENVATLVIALRVFVEFVRSEVPGAIGDDWTGFLELFEEAVPSFAQAQNARVRGETVDQMVLGELARGLRVGDAHLGHVGQNATQAAQGTLVGGYDRDNVYLIPSVVTRWASDQLRRGGRISEPIGRRTLGAAFGEREGHTGKPPQLTLAGRRHRVWTVARSRLSSDWEGLLDGTQGRTSDSADLSKA